MTMIEAAAPVRHRVSPNGTDMLAFSITVIVPTWLRPASLAECLSGLIRQERAPDEVIGVVRDIDIEGQEVLRSYIGRLPLRIVVVRVPGTIAALNAALEVAAGTLVSITDDDAVPKSDWLRRIEAWFRQDPAIGAVGGRDLVHQNGIPTLGERSDVGRIQWYGRTVGNHHLGAGPARNVDFLKGVNMSFRREAVGSIRLNTRLRGRGAQEQNEMDFCLAVRDQGWRIVYDPAVLVDHHPARRPEVDRVQHSYEFENQSNAAFNHTLCIYPRLSFAGRLFMPAWSVLIGTSEFPGLAQAMRLLLLKHPNALGKTAATINGRIAGFRDCLRVKS
jgi:cellulose synthase/poly-beta-1,6-N-acetylglucosamine synthase-like glycosyltransferase